MRLLFYLQIISALVCFGVIVKINYFTNPFNRATAEMEEKMNQSLETKIAEAGRLDLDGTVMQAIHSYRSSLQAQNEAFFNMQRTYFWLLHLVSTLLFFSGLCGLALLAKGKAKE